jgi:hypothetical protein
MTADPLPRLLRLVLAGVELHKVQKGFTPALITEHKRVRLQAERIVRSKGRIAA